MKLAQALHERADLQRRIAQLKTRLLNNAKVQEGDTPAEAPAELLQELDRDIAQLEELVRRINLTNSAPLPGGSSLTALIAQKDMLALKLSVLREFLDAASSKVDRYSNTEIRVHSTVDVRKLQKQVDELSKQLRLLDVHIQELNWTTELMQ